MGSANRATPAATTRPSTGDDAHRPHRPEQGAEPGIERVPAVERIGRQQVEDHQEEVGRRQHRQRQAHHAVARARGLAREPAEPQPQPKFTAGPASEMTERANAERGSERSKCAIPPIPVSSMWRHARA